MKKIERFWIHSNTYGIIDEYSTLVFFGNFEAAKAECERLKKLREEFSGCECPSSYEVVKLTDEYTSEIFGNL